MADIARRAGVSKVSVSYALSGKGRVSSETRQRILAIAEDLHWRPHTAALALSGAHAGAYGLVIARPADALGSEPYFMELVAGIEQALAGQSTALVLKMVESLEEEIAVHDRWWAERRVDGVLVMELRAGDPRLAALNRLGMPAVVMGDRHHAGPFPAIWHDQKTPSQEVARYFAALGHKRVARVAGTPNLLHVDARNQAFIRSAQRARMNAVARPTDFTADAGARVTRSLLLAENRPTAICYENDIMAVAGLSVAHELGFRLPDDLSIVAGIDSTLCRVVHPPLSALSWDVEAQGRHAMELLLDVVGHGQAGSRQEPPARLVPRGTTGPAPVFSQS